MDNFGIQINKVSPSSPTASTTRPEIPIRNTKLQDLRLDFTALVQGAAADRWDSKADCTMIGMLDPSDLISVHTYVQKRKIPPSDHYVLDIEINYPIHFGI